MIRSSNCGLEGGRCDEVTPMLLNEVQSEHEDAQAQDALITAQAANIASLEQQLAAILPALVEPQPQDEPITQR